MKIRTDKKYPTPKMCFNESLFHLYIAKKYISKGDYYNACKGLDNAIWWFDFGVIEND